MKARGYKRPGTMNKLEAAYALELEARRQAGEVIWVVYESITLKLADDCRYTPDFAVMRSDGLLEMHETKGGFIRDDARVKLRVAAGKFPFRFLLVRARPKREGGGFSVEEV